MNTKTSPSKRAILAGSIAALSLGTGAFAQTNGTWTLNANGNWSVTNNWLGGVVADGIGATAFFDVDINADRTITLDTARTIGNLSFRDTASASNAYILAGANVLTLNDGAGKPTITVHPRTGAIIARIDSVLAGTNGFELVAGVPGTLGELGLNAANTFTGAVTIGPTTRLRTDNDNALGVKDALTVAVSGVPTVTNFTEVLAGGTLNTNGRNLGTEYIKVQGAGIGGAGAIVNLGGQQNNTLQQVEMTGDATFGGTGRWDIRTGGTATGRLYQNGFTLTKTGTNQVSLVGVRVVGGGNININQGLFFIEGSTIVENTGEITVNSGGSLNFWANTGSVTRQIVANGGTISHTNTTAAATIASPIRFQANTTIRQDGTGTLNLTGGITETAPFNLTKVGTGRLNLGSASSFTGLVDVTQGTLGLTASGSLTANNAVTIASGSVFDVSATAGHTIGGAKALTVGRVGTTGSNDVVGSVVFASTSSLEIGPSARNGGASPIRIATISGGANFNNDTTAYFDLSNVTTPGGGINDIVNVGGTLTFGGTTNIRLTPVNGGYASGNYTLFTSGTLVGTPANLALQGVPTGTRQTFSFDTTTVPNSVLLNVAGASASLVWVGNGTTNTWDVNGAALWNNAGSPDVFKNLDSVLIDDTGSNSPAINLTGSISAASILVDAANDYTFGGTGTIDGGSLTKSLGGKLTITGTNHAFPGAVLIKAGTVSVSAINNAGTPGALGISPTITFEGGELEFTGTSQNINRTFALTSSAAVDVTTPGVTLGTNQAISGTGVLTLNGAGVFLAGRDDADYTFSTKVAGSGNLALNPHMVAGSTTSRQVTISADNTGFTGGIVLQSPASGTYRVPSVTQTALGSATVTVENGAQLYVASAATITNNANITGIGYLETNGTGLGAIRLDNATYAGNLNIVGSAAINAHNSIGTVTGNISGGTLLTGGTNFNNNITIVLTGTNTYGATVVNDSGTGNQNSMLQIGNGGTTGTLGTGPVTINGDNKNGILRFDRSDSYGLAVGQTITAGGSNQSKVFLDLDVTGTGFNNNGQTIDLGTPGGGAGFIRVGVTRADALATLTGIVEAGNIQVGVLNTGVPTTNAKLVIASGATVSASNLNVANGSATAPLGNTNGASVTVQAGSSFAITGGVFLGEQNSSAGSITQEGGTVTVGGQFRVGHWPNNTSTYTMNGGNLTLTGTPGAFPYTTGATETSGGIYLGIDGTGVFAHTAGTVSTRFVVLDNRGNTGTTDVYNLDGGELILTNAYGIINRHTSTAFSMNGGTLTAGTSFNIDSNVFSVNAASTLNTNGNTVTVLAPLGGASTLSVAGAGTLETGDSATTGFSGGGSLSFVPVTIGAGSTLRSNRAGNDLWSGTIDGPGGLVKDGTGDLGLQAANLYSGQTIINAGTLSILGSLPTAGTVTINGPGALGGPGTVGAVTSTGGLRPGTVGSADGDIGTLNVQSLTVNLGADLRVDIDPGTAASDKVAVAGTANFTDSSTISPVFSATPVSPATYTVLTAGTLVPTVVPTVTLPNGPTRLTLVADTTTTPNTVLLKVSGSTKTLNWNATNSGLWDTNSAINWKDGVVDETFYTYDQAVFPDAALDKNVIIDVAGVRPASVTVNNSIGNDYTFSGGAIAGSTGITKQGTGTLTLASPNANTGATLISGGVLKIGTNLKPLGENFAVTVTSGATFDVNGRSGTGATRRYDLTIEGSGAPGLAAIWNSGGYIVNNPIYRSITLTGDASIGGIDRYDINGGTLDGTGVSFDGGTFTLTKVGTSELWWSPNVGATVGSVVVDGGIFGVQTTFNLGDNTFPIVVNAAGELRSYSDVTNDKPIVINGGWLATQNQTGTWTGTVGLNGAGTTNRIGGGGVGIVLGGVISGNGFEKVGANVLTLQNGGNSWTGDTKVSGGTLIVNTGGILSPNSTLDMNGGTVDINLTTQTVAGLKGATGTIQGGAELIIDQTATTTYSGAIAAGMTITKDGTGELTLNGTQSYTVLNVDDGTLNLDSALLAALITTDGGETNINASVAGSTVNANDGVVNVNVSTTLAALNIGAGGVVVIGGGGPAPADALAGGDAIVLADPFVPGASELAGGGVEAVPEPASASLLLIGAIGLIARRRRVAQS